MRIFLTALSLAVLTTACGNLPQARQNTSVGSSPAPSIQAGVTTATSAAGQASSAATPEASGFKLRVKILSKECFGEAGCNVTYTIRVAYEGEPYDMETPYEITYKITGADDPIIGTFTMTGRDASISEEESTGTPSSSATLKAKVTEVEKS